MMPNYVKVKALRGEGFWLVADDDPRLGTMFERWEEPQEAAGTVAAPSDEEVPAAPPKQDISPYDTPIRPRGRRR